MRKTFAFLILSITCIFYGCAENKADRFIGCYLLEADGVASLKINKHEDKYFASFKEDNYWSKSDGLHQAEKEEIVDLFKGDSKFIKSGLVADDGPFGIFEVERGQIIAGQIAVSDYMAFIIYSTAPVYKVSCN